jgi:predicted nucleotidyltransferase
MNHLNPDKRSKPFDISVWRRANEKIRRRREQQRLKAYDSVRKAIDQLEKKYPFDAIYFFGSLTKPYKFSNRSDIDIAIEGLDKYLHYRFISELSGLLNREVDVVRLEDCPFAENVKTRGVPWKKPT